MVTPLDKRPRSGPYAGLTARSAKRVLAKAFQEAGLPFADEDALEIVLDATALDKTCLLYTSPSPRDGLLSRMPSSA